MKQALDHIGLPAIVYVCSENPKYLCPQYGGGKYSIS